MDAYLNDQNIYEPVTLDPQHLNSFLFVDLHSTSSETFPETYSRHMMQHHPANTNNTTTNGLPYRSWRRPTLSDVKARFVMRERSPANTLSRLPQLRQQIVQIENGGEAQDNSLTTLNPELLSTDLSLTTDDYDDSHAYHVHQHQNPLMQKIDEEAPTTFHPLYQDEKQRLFELVSIYRGDDSDAPSFVNRSILV